MHTIFAGRTAHSPGTKRVYRTYNSARSAAIVTATHPTKQRLPGPNLDSRCHLSSLPVTWLPAGALSLLVLASYDQQVTHVQGKTAHATVPVLVGCVYWYNNTPSVLVASSTVFTGRTSLSFHLSLFERGWSRRFPSLCALPASPAAPQHSTAACASGKHQPRHASHGTPRIRPRLAKDNPLFSFFRAYATLQ
jgi:hypothetical protein